MTGLLRIVVAASVVLVLVGCIGAGAGSSNDSDDGNGGSGDDVDPTIETELFVAGSEPGSVVFRTNDPAHTGPSGATYWHMGSLRREPMNAVEVEMFKVSGDPGMGYGVTFAMRDIGTFLLAQITVEGTWQIGRVVEREYTALTDWTASTELGTGYNRINTVRIEYDGAENAFTLFINGVESWTFDDDPDQPLNGGAFGHIVTLSPTEQFPNEEVHVEFRQLEPSDIGLVEPAVSTAVSTRAIVTFPYRGSMHDTPGVSP